LSITYCISSALKRYESGTATGEKAVADAVHQRVEFGERRTRRCGAAASVDDHRGLVGLGLGVYREHVERLVHGREVTNRE
jgi:hypothetical protein